jgi:DNA primase
VIDTLTVNHYTSFKSLALYGTNGFTQEHEQAIRELQHLQEVILFFDGDEAGRKAVEKYTEQLKAIKPGITISNVNTPEGEDPNSLIQSHEQEILTHLIDKRQILFSSSAYTKVPADKNEEKNTLATSSFTTVKLNTKNPEYITYAYENLNLHIIGGIAIYPIDKLKITLKIVPIAIALASS